MEGLLKEKEVHLEQKNSAIVNLEDGCRDMETTFTSTVNSLQDLLQTKDKAVQGLCDQMTKLKDEVSIVGLADTMNSR